MDERKLVELARERVGPSFKVIGFGRVGEPSNGALYAHLADALEARLARRRTRALSSRKPSSISWGGGRRA